MVAVTYGGSRAATPAVAAAKPAKLGKGFFARLFDAICDAQMRRAERELAMHRHLLPHDFKLERVRWSDKKDQAPIGGW